MNHYPDNYHGYGRDASNMQGMAYGGYRDSPAMRGHPAPEYQGGGYPMGQHHGAVGGRGQGMYGQARPGPYNVPNYGHYNSPGYMGHQGGMVNPYYNSHGQMPGSAEGYNMHQAQHMGMMGPNHQRHALGSRGGAQHCASPAGQDHYGAAYPGQGSPSRMHLQHQGHSSHPQVPVPQHPMRQTNTQQNPQEVADNILQMASSYPSNQTVQVPLKNRPAPYHIPRSPHLAPRQDQPHNSSPSPHHQQQVLPSHTSPSPTSGVKSPIGQNLTPSPGPGMLRSPSGQVMSPCGSQRSPSHSGSAYPSQVAAQTSQMTSMSPASHPAMASSSQPQQYHNHQHHHPPQQSHLVHQSDSPHYSPCSMVQSPYSASPSAQAQSAPYSPHNPNHNPPPAHHHHQTNAASMAASPPANNMPAPYVSSPNNGGHCSTFAPSPADTCNNPLMSLEKLVMLPETQVVDPKSVVNDACLSTQSEEGPKNVEDPAERPVESSGLSVGCSGLSSSLTAQSVDTNDFAESASKACLGSISSLTDQVVTTTSGQVDSNSVSDTSVLTASASADTDSGKFCTDSDSQPKCANSADQNVLVMKHFEPPNALQNSTSADDHSKKALPHEPSNNIQNEMAADGSFTESVSKAHQVGGAEAHNLAESLKTSQTLLAPTTENHGHSCILTKITDEPSSSSGSSESDISSASVDLLPTSLPKDGQDFSKSSELMVSLDNDRTSNLKGSISSQKAVNDSRNCTESLDMKDSRKQEPVLLSTHMPEKESNTFKKLEDSSLVALSKNAKAKEDIKLFPVPCHPPSVLSEVPIILNGVEGAPASETDADQELDYNNGIHSKVHNGLNSIVKTKLGFSRRASHLNRVTPCSIAVEASERAVCERFALRRNGLSRVTRTSTNRERNNSTGNADSDESLENISNSSLLSSREPHDGTRKRGPSSSSKRNGFSKTVVVSSFTKNSENSSTTTPVSLDKNSVSHGNNAGSDEEPFYYEGVDNSYDAYMNTLSSDESGLSDDKGNSKQSKQQDNISEAEKPADESVSASVPPDKKEMCDDSSAQTVSTQEPGAEGDSAESISPPAKKLKASPASTTGKVGFNHSVSEDPSEVIDLTSEIVSPIVKKENASPGKRSAEKFRPSILSRRTLKYPVVVLEKSPIISPKLLTVKKESSDLINVSEGSTPQQLACANLPDVKTENISCPETANTVAAFDGLSDNVSTANKVENIKEESEAPLDPSMSNLSKKNSPKKGPKKRKAAKPKGKGKQASSNRQSDVTDSFKSMKFGRTLDLMKANRKRESGSIGPFVRIVGRRSSPKTVSLFAQPTAEALAATKQGKTSAGAKKGQSGPTMTTVHMVSNLTSKGPPMVPSTRTISQKPWVCAFCGHHSSYKFLGDLFGPYFNENEVGHAEKLALEESKKESEKNPKSQDSGKKTASKSHSPSAGTSSAKHQRRKSALHPRVVEDPAPLPEEMWVHQACALWSPGVCLVGNKMYGLEEAVKDAAENACSECKKVGAMIGCLHKGCPMKYHFVCAVEKDCYLDEENLSLLCPKHKEKKLGSASTSKS